MCMLTFFFAAIIIINRCGGATFSLCDIKRRCEVPILLLQQNGSGNNRWQAETILVNCRPALRDTEKRFALLH